VNRTRLRRHGPHLAVLVAVLVLAGCSKDVKANELDVGVCVADEDALNSAEIETVSCDDEHRFELIARFDLEGDDWPGDDDVRADAEAGCQGDRFTDYVGQTYEEATDVLVTPLPPTEDTWKGAGDRTVLCFAHTPGAEPTTGSLRDEAA
jgi:hypothetical protein